MCLYRESGPVVCLYRGWAEGVHVQSVTQILVAPVKVGATACVTHHCRAFFSHEDGDEYSDEDGGEDGGDQIA